MRKGPTGWVIDNLPVLVPMLLLIVSGILVMRNTHHFGPGLLLSTLGLSMVLGYKEVKASEPPQYGVLSIWGRLLGNARGPGYYLTANYFPFFITYVTVSSSPTNLNFNENQTDIPTNGIADPKSPLEAPVVEFELGAIGQAEWSVTFVPDEQNDAEGNTRLIQFIKYGGVKGILDVLEDAGDQYFMRLGRNNHWKRMVSSPDEITCYLIGLFTGQTNRPGESMQDLLVRMAKEKFPDRNGWGIRFLKINMWRFRVDKKIEDAATDTEVELQQQRSEMTEAKTLQKLAEVYGKTFPGLSGKQIMQALQVERGKAGQTYVDGDLAGGIVLKDLPGASKK